MSIKGVYELRWTKLEVMAREIDIVVNLGEEKLNIPSPKTQCCRKISFEAYIYYLVYSMIPFKDRKERKIIREKQNVTKSTNVTKVL